MIFLSAQPLSTYFLWQTTICTTNLFELGVKQNDIHVLFSRDLNCQMNLEDDIMLQNLQQLACVYFYEECRKVKQYLSSIRPNIIGQHFLSYPLLESTIIFYHDADIIFRALPPLFKYLTANTWYVSDTANYLDTNYIKEFIGNEHFLQMCNIVNIAPELVLEQDAHCGGAQYVLQNVPISFWQKVEKDCEAIYHFLETCNLEKKISYITSNNNPMPKLGIQSWCADMWAVLWNALYFKRTVRVHKDIDFC